MIGGNDSKDPIFAAFLLSRGAAIAGGAGINGCPHIAIAVVEGRCRIPA